MVRMIERRMHTSTNTIQPPEKNDPYNLATRTSGGGEINKHLGYILIVGNVETWLNYAKAKGVGDQNKETNTRR